MSFELLEKITAGNNTVPHLKGFRIKGTDVIATDLVSTVLVKNQPTDKLDCFVNSELFMKSYKMVAAPSYTVQGEQLIVVENRFTANIPLIPNELFPDDQSTVPNGTKKNPGNILDALERVSPFLGMQPKIGTSNVAFIMDGYIYVTDGMVLVRTKVDSELGRTTDPKTSNNTFYKVVLPKSFINNIQTVKSNLIEFIETDEYVVAMFESCWLKTAKPTSEAPIDFEKYCSVLETMEMKKLDDEVFEDMKRMCTAAGANDFITLKDGEITLLNDGASLFKIKTSLDIDTRVRPDYFKKILAISPELAFFEDKIAFRGTEIEGFITTA